MSEGAFLKDLADFRNALTVEWTGKNLSSPRRVVQYCLKSGSGTLKSTYLELAFLLTMNWNPLSDEYLMYPVWNPPL